MTGSFNKVDHLSGGMKRQGVMGEARPRRDVGCHFARETELPFGRLGEQRDHQILQRDHANAELHQFGIRQRGNLGLRFGGNRSSLRPAGSGAAFVVPSRRAIWRWREEAEESGFLSGMRRLPETRESARLRFTAFRPVVPVQESGTVSWHVSSCEEVSQAGWLRVKIAICGLNCAVSSSEPA
jgi:hypothetical protein